MLEPYGGRVRCVVNPWILGPERVVAYAGHVLAATHYTGPWYLILVPIVLFGTRLVVRFRRAGRRGPFGGGRGPFSGTGGRGMGGSSGSGDF